MSLLSLLSFSGVCSRLVRIFVILIDQATFIAIVHPGDLPSACSVCEHTFCGYVRYVWFELHLTHFSIVLVYGLFEAELGFDASHVFIRMPVYQRLLLSGHVMTQQWHVRVQCFTALTIRSLV